MDKQKQIEEMAKIICEDGANNVDCDKCGFRRQCSRFKAAEKLCSEGYRRIPGNAVVLTNDEFWALSNKFSKKELDEIVEFHKKKTRKETAEKFAERLKEKLEENSPIAGYDLEDLEFDGDTIQECINETYNEIIKGEIQ